jgi:hypothetical protein
MRWSDGDYAREAIDTIAIRSSYSCVDPAPSYVPVFRDAVVEQRR